MQDYERRGRKGVEKQEKGSGVRRVLLGSNATGYIPQQNNQTTLLGRLFTLLWSREHFSKHVK